MGHGQTIVLIKGNVRIYLSDFSALAQTILSYHSYLPFANLILAHALTALVPLRLLYRASKLLVQIKTTGPIEMLLIEMAANQVRALVANGQIATEYDQSRYNEIPLPLGLGPSGTLHVSRIVNNQTFTSEVALVAADVVTDLAYFLNQSDQIFSAVVSDVRLDPQDSRRVLRAQNALFQLLPGHTEADVTWIETFIKHHPLKNYDLATYIRLVGGQILTSHVVGARCWCDRTKLIRALTQLSPAAQATLRADAQPLESRCDFCNRQYVLTSGDF